MRSHCKVNYRNTKQGSKVPKEHGRTKTRTSRHARRKRNGGERNKKEKYLKKRKKMYLNTKGNMKKHKKREMEQN